ncbi:hypothetical protein [Nocardia nova]
MPDTPADDWDDWEGATVPGRGHALARYAGGEVEIAVMNERTGQEAVITLRGADALKLADAVTAAADDTPDDTE